MVRQGKAARLEYSSQNRGSRNQLAAGNWQQEVRGHATDDRPGKSEVGGQRSDDRGQNFELQIVDCGFGFASHGCAVIRSLCFAVIGRRA